LDAVPRDGRQLELQDSAVTVHRERSRLDSIRVVLTVGRAKVAVGEYESVGAIKGRQGAQVYRA
jgi:hypothetical protein